MFKFLIANITLSAFLIFLFLFIISFFTLWERKLMAGIQRRQGPNFIGLFGLLQPFADGLKLIFKEINVPLGVYYYIFFISSISSLVLSLLSWTVIPFNSAWVIADINLGILFILMISSLNVYTILFSGWSSNNKYGFLGSIRSGAQMISYELPLSISLIIIVLISKTMNFINIVNFQIEWAWCLILALPAALIFLVSAFAETNRTPFDLPEAESELVAGYNIEYSSLSFAVFFLAEYNHILIMSFLFSIVFLGGWSLFFFNVTNTLINEHFYAAVHDIRFFKLLYLYLKIKLKLNLFYFFYYSYCLKIVYFVETFILVIKSLIIVNFFIIIRASVPRYKFTQLIEMCWNSFIPFIMVYFYIVYLYFLTF